MNVKLNGSIVGMLRSSLYEAKGLGDVPGLIKKIIKEESWRIFYDEVLNDIVHHETFTSFVTSPTPEGLGITVKQLVRYCLDDPEVVTEIEELTTGEWGGNHQGKTDNVRLESQYGNAAGYGLRKLHKDRPDLHQQILKGELSTNAAMIKAGFRKKTVSLLIDPEKWIIAIHKYFADEEIEYIKSGL